MIALFAHLLAWIAMYLVNTPATLDYWDGFDEYANLTDAAMFGWANAGTFAVTGRISGTAVRLSNQNCILTNAYIVSGTRQTVGVAWQVSVATAPGAILRWYEGATNHVILSYNGNGTFTITRNVAAITFGTGSSTTSAVTISSGTWYYLEWDVTCDDTAGAWEFRVNGVTIGSGSGGDTRNGGTGVLDTFWLSAPNGTQDLFDDLYIASGSSSFQGDSRVITQAPNASGNYTQWTPNASTNLSRVNQTTQDGDTTYNSDATSGHRDSFTFPSLGVTGTILGVIAAIIARKDDAGTRNVKVSIRQGGTDYDGASTALGASYTSVSRKDLVDPSTSSAWSVSGVNSAEIGYLDV